MSYINTNTNFDNYKTKYIRIPMEIAENDTINPIDKLVYASLRNRLNFSIQNNQYDEKGYFLFYTQKKLANELGVTPRTISTVFERLKEANLIDYFEEGNCNKIYICEYDVEAKYLLPKKEKEIPSKPVQEPNFSAPETPLSFYANLYDENFSHEEESYSEIISCYSEKNVSYGESFACQDETFSSNNNIYNNTNNYNKSIYQSSNTNNFIDSEEMERVKEFYYDLLDMYHLKDQYPHEPLLDEIFWTVIDMHFSEYTVINKQSKPRELIRNVLGKLTHMNIEDVMVTYRNQTINIEFPHSYLKTMIYNSAMTLQAKSRNRMMYDSYGRVEQPSSISTPNLDADYFDNFLSSGII